MAHGRGGRPCRAGTDKCRASPRSRPWPRAEPGLAYRAAEDGLLLDEPALDTLLSELDDWRSPQAAVAHRAGPVAATLLAWSLPYRTVRELREAIGRARTLRNELRRDDVSLVLATAHGTKGLEFDHVAVIGMDENVFPSRRTIEDADDPARADRGGAPPRLRRLDARQEVTDARL